MTVSFVSLEVRQQEPDRVAVRGAQGSPPPDTLKVSATYRDGFRAAGQLTICGDQAVQKAQRAADVVIAQLKQSGTTFRDTVVEMLGTGACFPIGATSAFRQTGANQAIASQPYETVLRIAVADDSRESVDRFSRAIMPLITAGPPGTTGYAEGRPRVHPQFGYWPCLIERRRVCPVVQLLPCVDNSHDTGTKTDLTGNASAEPVSPELPSSGDENESGAINGAHSDACKTESAPQLLADIALARSGDKGKHANIGVIARTPDNYERLRTELTPERVASYFGIADPGRVLRFELPNLAALNFVVHGILDNPLRIDPQGKALGQLLLQMPLSCEM